MNRFIIWVFVFSGLALAGEHQPVQVPLTLSGVFTVEGFDDNDRVQITVKGTLPNTCYKVAKSEASVDAKRHVISVRQEGFLYQGNCLQIPASYSDVINVGILSEGDYSVVDASSAKALGKLHIDAAQRPEADDYLYAGVEDAYVVHEERENALVLQGKFLDSCTQYSDEKFNYTENAIIVQPIAKRADGACKAGSYPFTKRYTLPAGLTGSYLLHVRAMNGQAINKLVDLF